MIDEKKLQEMLDADKWYESERAERDMCGEFPFCIRCDKAELMPCAKAYNRFYGKE